MMETLQTLCTLLYYYGAGPPLPSVQPQCFLECTPTSFEQSLAEFFTILLEVQLQVALEMLEVGFVPHSSLQN
jgi:hypothetical protein